jgi:hypothetical protein
MQHSVDVMVYETDGSSDSPAQTLVGQIKGRIDGMNIEVFGLGDGFKGFGSKFSAALPHLRSKDPEALVVIADSRDVLVNNPHYDQRYTSMLADEFKVAYEHLTYDHPNAIVVSAESQCCVSALTHARPGDYFNQDGSRSKRACSSGEADCMWNGDSEAQPWESFMKQRMFYHVKGAMPFDDMYLNAGLMAGKAKNLIRVIEAVQIEDSEDDQAVLTDYMYRHPQDIVLDYEQTMFGNNRGATEGLSKEERCTFRKIEGESRLVHTVTNTSPLFVHSPGGFYECHDALAHVLGVPVVTTEGRKLSKCNYGKCSEFPQRDPTALEQYLLGGRQ